MFGPTMVTHNKEKRYRKIYWKIRRCVISNLFRNLVFNCQFGFFVCAHIVLFLLLALAMWCGVFASFFFLFSLGRSTTFSRLALIRIICIQHSLLDVWFSCWIFAFFSLFAFYVYIFIPFHLIEICIRIYEYNK